MSVKIYLRSSTATPTIGTDTTKFTNPSPGYLAAASATAIARGTVAGPTAPLQFTDGAGGNTLSWVSDPLAWAVTIAGTVSINIRAKVDAAAANATVEMKVLQVDGAGAILSTVVAVPPAVIPAALTTSDAALAYTVTPTSTAFAAGDRIVLQVYIDDGNGVNMAAAHTVTISIDASNGAAGAGDSWVQFTENIAFTTTSNVWAVAPADVPTVNGISDYAWPGTSGQQINATGIDPAQP